MYGPSGRAAKDALPHGGPKDLNLLCPPRIAPFFGSTYAHGLDVDQRIPSGPRIGHSSTTPLLRSATETCRNSSHSYSTRRLSTLPKATRHAASPSIAR